MGIWDSLTGRRFIAVDVDAQGAREVRIGFESLGRRRVLTRFPLSVIKFVECGPGQGQSDRDWNVAIWFDHGDPERTKERQRWARHPDQDVVVVAAVRPKAKTQIFLKKVIEFLNAVGVDLEPDASANRYARPAAAA